MSWQLLILLNAIAFALSTLSIRAVARHKKAGNASFVMGTAQSLFLFICTLLFIPILGAVDFKMFSEYFWWFLGGGVAAALGNACSYKVLSYLEAGISSILNTIYVVFVVILAAIVLNEVLGPTQFIGGALLLIAVTYSTWIARHPDIKKKHDKAWIYGLFFAFLGGIIIAVAIVNEKYLIDRMDISTYLVISLGWQLLFTFIAAITLQRHMLFLLRDKSLLRLNVVNGFLRAVAGVFLVLAIIKNGNIALITVVSNFQIIIVMLLGAVLLKEHQRMTKKLAAASLATMGLIIIFWK